MRKREEVLLEDTWNMTDMMPDDKAWEALFCEAAGMLKGYEEFRTHLADSAKALYDCLRFDEELSLKIERLYVYGKQKSDENTANAVYQDYAARALTLSYQAAENSAFIVPELLAMDEKVLKSYFQEYEALLRYARSIEVILKKKAHTLSSQMEALLARSLDATQGVSQVFTMFNNADARFPVIENQNGEEIQITHGNYIALMENQDRRVRKDAFLGLYQVYGQFSNTLAAAFAANVKQAHFYADVRNYPSSRAYYLAENEIPESVYDNLIGAVRERLPLLHDYVAARKKALALDELHMYDLYVPMMKREEREIPFHEAKAMALSGLAPLGEEYVSLLSRGFRERWIDVYENEGKRSGAYSWGAYGTHPYVLLNYNGTLDSVFTLVHEMGHALHTYYSNENQSYVDAGYKIFVAEVASTCNEALLIRYLLEHTEDKAERSYLINHFLESFRGTLFRQTMFAEFEAEAHRRAQAGEVLTAKLLCQMYHKLNEEYFGPEMVVDPEIDSEWARIPHFYTPFYVYQYATGFSAAIAISRKLLAGDEKAREGYFQFLRGGNSMPPIELLKLAGVDLSSPEPVQAALKVFGELLEEWKEGDKE